MIAEQLRKSILQAAIQGKLAEQLPEDGDARELLKEIQKEKQRLIREGKIKKEKPLPKIAEDEIPFEIPANWCWVRLGEIGSSFTDGVHFAPKYHVSGVPCISAKDIYNDKINFDRCNHIADADYQSMREKLNVRKGSLLFTKSGSIGRTCIVNGDERFGLVESVGVINLMSVNAQYTKSVFELVFDGTGVSNQYTQGIGVKHLTLTLVKSILIPLPPFSEQKRIVKRLEEVLPVIYKLAGDETKLDELLRSFPRKMKDTVLQAAIQGKLTEHLPEDGDARDLLKEIQTKKQRLIIEGKIKKEKPLPEIKEEEIPFDVPANWCWVRLDQICVKITDGSHNPPADSGDGVPMISAKNLKNGSIDFTQSKRFVTHDQYLMEDKRTEIRKGDVLLSIVGTIGETAIVKENIDIVAQRSVCVLRTLAFNEYIDACLKSSLFTKFSSINQAGTAQKGLYLNSIRKLVLPLPPISEQHRIVHRLEEVLTIIDKLERDKD